MDSYAKLLLWWLSLRPAQVDNVILRDPPMLRSPLFAGLNLLPMPQPVQQPCPGAWCDGAHAAWQDHDLGESSVADAPCASTSYAAEAPSGKHALSRPWPHAAEGAAADQGPRSSSSTGASGSGAARGDIDAQEAGRPPSGWLGLRAPVPLAVGGLVRSARSAASARSGDAVGWLSSLGSDGACMAAPPCQAGAP